ncbi:MAG TPA: GxxExxY protein [Rhizomicrobium sp.]
MIEETPRRQDAKTIEPSRDHDRIAHQIVDSAFVVHQALGPGLLESVYEQCLFVELSSRGLGVLRQISVPLSYRDIRLDVGFRMDLLVDSLVVVEIKAAENILPVHEAQLLTYLKLSGHRLGILVNFNVTRIKDGLRRIVHTS